MLYTEYMAKVTIRREGGVSIEADLTFEQLKELIGVNGNGHKPTVESQIRQRPVTVPTMQEPDFAGFMDALSPRGRDFINLLRSHRNGIEANDLAGKLGYQDAKQIGGLTGGGLAKIAKKKAVKLKDIYRADITFPEGKRTVIFRPGKLILAIDE